MRLKWRIARAIRTFQVPLAMVFGMFIGAFALPLIRAGDIYEYQDTVDGVHLPEVDAIVCLAGGRGRIAAAGDLWYRYNEGLEAGEKPPILYISGMGRQASWSSFRRQLRTGVRDVVRPEHVILENESYNTETNAIWLSKYIAENHWKRIILITSPYHMKRAAMIFGSILQAKGTPVQIDTLSAFQEPFEPGEWRSSVHGVEVTFTEYLKWVYYKYLWKPTPVAL